LARFASPLGKKRFCHKFRFFVTKSDLMDDVYGASAAVKTLHTTSIEVSEAYKRLGDAGAMEGDDAIKAAADLRVLNAAITRVSEHLQQAERGVRARAVREAQERCLQSLPVPLALVSVRPARGFQLAVETKDAVTSPLAGVLKPSTGTDHSVTASFGRSAGALASAQFAIRWGLAGRC
jgi:hypothetical protein